MNIAENILKHNLQNVYFLSGTALAGKTTMSKVLAKKYGFIHFNDNWHEDNFIEYRSICNEKYQPISTKKKETTDWEAFFGRTVDEFLAANVGRGENDEYIEYALVYLIKLSQKGKVVADISVPISLLVEISDYNRIACMLTSPELVTCENYGKRDDHREFIECILSLKEPEKKIAVQDELFRIETEKTFEEVKKYNLFNIVRTEDSTIEKTLKLLEEHFHL
jgi:adenylate kinase family enzyme